MGCFKQKTRSKDKIKIQKLLTTEVLCIQSQAVEEGAFLFTPSLTTFTKMGDVDLINRDPNGINSHLKCTFEDVLAEPDDIHSMDFCWKTAFSCFNFWKNCCYRLSTFCCGCCIAMELGCEFANIAFTHIWCLTPMLRQCAISCNPYQKLWGLCCNCCFAPICEACGMYFSNIKVNMQKG